MLAFRILRDERGATAIEYGLIAALVSMAILAGLNSIGGQVGNTFVTVENEFDRNK